MGKKKKNKILINLPRKNNVEVIVRSEVDKNKRKNIKKNDKNALLKFLENFYKKYKDAFHEKVIWIVSALSTLLSVLIGKEFLKQFNSGYLSYYGIQSDLMIDNQETLWKIIFWLILVVIILYYLLNIVAKVVVKAEKYVNIKSTKIKPFCILILNFIVSFILCFFVSAITIFLINFFINPGIEKVICLMIYSLIQGIKWVIFATFIFSFIVLYIVYKVNKNLKKNTQQEKDSRYGKGFKIFMCVMCSICIIMYYFLMNILGECVAINKRVYTSFIDENEFYLVIGKIDGKYLCVKSDFVSKKEEQQTVKYMITELDGKELYSLSRY